MLDFIRKFVAGICQNADAIDIAMRHVESRTGDRAHRSGTCVLHSDDLAFVIRVCYGRSKPPSRAWLRVLRSAAETQELSFDEVTQYGEKIWL
jgi:hypothetical protein